MNRVQIIHGLLLTAAFLLAWQHWFIQDDAYISFIYARHFAEGEGLRWWSGSNEFGYTNFLFTLLVGCLMFVGFPPETAASLITIPSFLASLILVFRLTKKLAPENRWAAYAASIATGIQFSVSSYATGGLETSFHMLLILAAYCAAFEKRALYFAIAASLALLTRLDSVLLLAPAGCYLLTQYRTIGLKGLAWVVYFPAIILALFLLWCHDYYGFPLPNSYFAKVELPRSFVPEGLEFIATFLSANLYLPLILLAVSLACCLPKTGRCLFAVALLLACVLWLAYIIKIGGDFMEFRLMVVIMPLFYVFCFSRITHFKHNLTTPLLAILLLAHVAIGLFYAPNFKPTRLIGSIPVLHESLSNPKHNWKMVGEALHEALYTGDKNDVRLALHTTGAIPYFSRLFTIDIYGINTRWVAQNGRPAGRIAGHRKIAPYNYLVGNRVNLVIPGLPVYVCNEEDGQRVRPYYDLPILLIKLASGCKVVAYYLGAHPKIDEAIRNNLITHLTFNKQ